MRKYWYCDAMMGALVKSCNWMSVLWNVPAVVFLATDEKVLVGVPAAPCAAVKMMLSLVPA